MSAMGGKRPPGRSIKILSCSRVPGIERAGPPLRGLALAQQRFSRGMLPPVRRKPTRLPRRSRRRRQAAAVPGLLAGAVADDVRNRGERTLAHNRLRLVTGGAVDASALPVQSRDVDELYLSARERIFEDRPHPSLHSCGGAIFDITRKQH